MKTLRLLTIAILAISSSTLFAQAYLIAHGGFSFPFSDYGDVNENNELATGAATGLSGHLSYVYPVSNFGLSIFGEMGINFNGLKKEYKDQYKEFYGTLLRNPDYKYSKYLSFPFSAGINYTYTYDKTYAYYGQFGIAGNMFKTTNMKVQTDNTTISTEYDWAFGSGVIVSFGLIYKDKSTFTFSMFSTFKSPLIS